MLVSKVFLDLMSLLIVLAEYSCGAGCLGYSSTATSELQQRLRKGSSDGSIHSRVHSRVLGNVLYLMASQSSKREELLGIERLVLQAL